MYNLTTLCRTGGPKPNPWLWRLIDSFKVLKGEALAVQYPLDQLTPDDIVIISHDLGLHDPKISKHAHTECADCFWNSFNKYKVECIALLEEFDSTQTVPFLDYLNRLVDDPNSSLSEKWWIMHEHVLYQVGGFLGFDHRNGGHQSEKFKELEVKYEMIRTRHEKLNAKDKPTD